VAGSLLVNFATNKTKIVIHLAVAVTLQNLFVGAVPSMMAMLTTGTGYRGADVE
jgi:hypothetical protein